MKLTVHTIETAPPAAQADLQAARKANGFIPNLLGIMAEAPIALKAYMEMSELLGKSGFTPVERQVMMIAGSVTNECGYCIVAHSTLAVKVHMPPPVLAALRDGNTLPDAKLEALRSFVSEVVSTRGRVSDARIQLFLDAGYTRANVLEVVFGAAMKTLSNYTNHMAETPVDAAFAPQTWTANALAGA